MFTVVTTIISATMSVVMFMELSHHYILMTLACVGAHAGVWFPCSSVTLACVGAQAGVWFFCSSVTLGCVGAQGGGVVPL